MVKRILAVIAAIVLLLATCMLSIGAEEAQTESAAGTTKWDNLDLYVQDHIASLMDHPEHFNIAQWVALADRESFGQLTQSFYINMVWNTENEGTTTARTHYLDRRYYDIALTGEELVADVNYYNYLVFEDELTQPRGREFNSLRIMASENTVGVYLLSSRNPEDFASSARIQYLYDIVSTSDTMVGLSLRQVTAKWATANSVETYTSDQIKGWLIYSLWDGENIANTNSPFERIMIAIMNYTPEDYQSNGDLLNGDLYFYGVIDYEAIKDTWTVMQRYAVDLGTHMYTEGKNLGLAEGHDRGYNNGLQLGYEDGFNAGYNQGYGDGDEDGYDRGFADASGDTSDVLQQEFENGYNKGVEQGHSDGYDEGYYDGKIAGETLGATSASAFANMFIALFEAPVKLMEGCLNFDFLGVNVLAFVKTLLTLSIVGLIVFLVFKLKK